MLSEQTEPPAPEAAVPASAPRRRRLLPGLALVCVLGLAGGLLVRRLGPRPVPPPVVPVYTPQQATQAQRHLEALREQLSHPAAAPDDTPSPSPPTAHPVPARPAPPRPLRLELSQEDLNAYLATNSAAQAFLARQGIRAVQINFEPPCNVLIRAAVVYRGRPANVQITGRVQSDRRTMLGFVATGAQAGRLPLPVGAVTAQANKLIAQVTRRLRGRLPFEVRTVRVIGDKLVLTGLRGRDRTGTVHD